MAWKKPEDDFFDDEDSTKNNSDNESSTSATSERKPPGKKRKLESVKRWGSPENRRFNDLVADGSIKLRKKVNCKIIDKIGEKHFAGRSIRSFRDHYRGLVSQLRLERKLAGGRKRLAGECSHWSYYFCRENSHSTHSPLPPLREKKEPTQRTTLTTVQTTLTTTSSRPSCLRILRIRRRGPSRRRPARRRKPPLSTPLMFPSRQRRSPPFSRWPTPEMGVVGLKFLCSRVAS